ncbi:YdeI/OmpD-associated family protein [Paenibacillus sp. P46E]|uniref:YdeI/OmpD-associated family protein n=1 Tax=Paenibacillus sp. P46E TaxID=1349436 RepID=UPI000AD5D000|nr:YdeI/OmpD-associated family protein [Paenibacillus sp. P46E]
MMKFQAIVQLSGKTATGIPVPEEVVAGLGTSKKPAVKVKIGEYTYASTIAVMGGQFLIPLSAEHRQGAGVSSGDEIEVELELDTEPRELTVPADFRDAIDREPAAKLFFDGLSYSNRRRLVLSVESAKTAETRQRRIEKAVGLLNEGRVQ